MYLTLLGLGIGMALGWFTRGVVGGWLDDKMPATATKASDPEVPADMVVRCPGCKAKIRFGAHVRARPLDQNGAS